MSVEQLPQHDSYPRHFIKWVGFLVFIRVITMVSLPLEGMLTYGDFDHFFDLAEFAIDGPGGLPYIGHWIEFPPLFPYLSIVLYLLSGGVEHTYVYLLGAVLIAFDAGSLWFFMKIAGQVRKTHIDHAAMAYVAFLAVPAFGWWTFDPIGVFFLLAGIYALMRTQEGFAGLAAGLGIITKFIPGLSVVIALRKLSMKKLVMLLAVVAGVLAVAFLPLLLQSPDLTRASFLSQFSKGSWETIWALLDGNLQTGLFGPLSEKLDAANAAQARGAPARIPHFIPTVVFGALGLWFFARTNAQSERSLIRLVAAALTLLLLWSRGWSPQWLSYLIPLLLLSLPFSEAIAVGLNLVVISLLEWPILLSRGRFDVLWLPVLLRTLLFLFLLVRLGRETVLEEA
jgi:hypothetical protein